MWMQGRARRANCITGRQRDARQSDAEQIRTWPEAGNRELQHRNRRCESCTTPRANNKTKHKEKTQSKLIGSSREIVATKTRAVYLERRLDNGEPQQWQMKEKETHEARLITICTMHLRQKQKAEQDDSQRCKQLGTFLRRRSGRRHGRSELPVALASCISSKGREKHGRTEFQVESVPAAPGATK